MELKSIPIQSLESRTSPHTERGEKGRPPMPILIGVACLVLTLAAGLWWFNAHRTPKVQPLTVATTSVSRQTMTQGVAATGRVVPNFEVEIKGKASGKIVRLTHDISDFVRQGELLVELDPIDEQRAVEQSQSSLNALEQKVDQSVINLQIARQQLQTDIDKAQATMNTAQAKLKESQVKEARLKRLYEQDFITKQDYEDGQTTTISAQTDLDLARTRFNELKTQKLALDARQQDIGIARSEAGASRVQLAQAEQRLSETRIYSPISGVITSQTGQIGQIVASGISNVGGGTSILTIADLSRIFVLASVDESDIGQVRLGQTVKITADAFPNENFVGKVVQIASKGVNLANVVTFEVKVEVISPNKNKLKPEMTTNNEIVFAEKPQALVVPSEAIAMVQGRPTASVVLPGNRIVRRRVVTGISNGTQIEVLEGLQAGDQVVIHKREASSEWRKKKMSKGPGGQSTGMMMMGGRH